MAIVERYRVECDTGCGAVGPDRDSREGAAFAAVDAWFRREPHPSGDAGFRCWVCVRAARRRDVVAARAGDGVAGGARGT